MDYAWSLPDFFNYVAHHCPLQATRTVIGEIEKNIYFMAYKILE